MKVIPETLHAH